MPSDKKKDKKDLSLKDLAAVFMARPGQVAKSKELAKKIRKAGEK